MDKSPACRQEGESVQDCVDRKVPELLEENPDWDQDQAVAAAHSICETPCSEKQMEQTMTRAGDRLITKHLGIPLEKGFESQDDGSILVRGYFTSDNVDEIGDVITREATENAIPKYRQWGNIRYMHMPKPVARMERIGSDDGLEWNEVEIKVIDPDAIFQVKNGLLKALSVGIFIKSWDDIEIDEETFGWTIHAYELAEISLVDHPANYDARLFLDDDKSVQVSSELRQMVAANGFATVAKALGSIRSLEEEVDMTQLEESLESDVDTSEEELEEATLEAEGEELEASLESEEGEEEVEPEADEEVEEELAMEESGTQLVDTDEEQDELMELLTDSVEAEELEEDEVDTEEEETIEEVESEAEFSMTPEFAAQVARALIDALETEVDDLTVDQPSQLEVGDEDEPEAINLQAQVEDLAEQVAALTEKVAELSKSARRVGQSKTHVLPHEAIEEIEAQEAEEGEGDLLKSAVRSYLSRPGQVQIRERS